MRFSSHVRSGRRLMAGMLILVALAGCLGGPAVDAKHDHPRGALERARVFLSAADYRRAVEACQEEVRDRPSASSYVYLTYVYHALGGFLDYHAAQDQWVVIEQLVRNLSGDRPEVLIDPPDILARIAKELISESVQRESDVSAAMAARLDKETTARLWQQQQAWRHAHPNRWWLGVPKEWGW